MTNGDLSLLLSKNEKTYDFISEHSAYKRLWNEGACSYLRPLLVIIPLLVTYGQEHKHVLACITHTHTMTHSSLQTVSICPSHRCWIRVGSWTSGHHGQCDAQYRPSGGPREVQLPRVGMRRASHPHHHLGKRPSVPQCVNRTLS